MRKLPKLLLLLVVAATLPASRASFAQVVLNTSTPNVDSFPIVRIPVSVTENNKPATGVTVSNFTVRQDGVQVSNLQLVDCAGSPSAAICFVVDTSQSMDISVGSGPSGNRTYQKFFNGFSAFLSSIPSPSQIALVEFAQYSTAWPGAPRWFFNSNSVDTTEFLIDLAAGYPVALGGWTNLDSAIVAGVQVLSHTSNPRKILVVVTDDFPNDSLGFYLASKDINGYFMDVARDRNGKINQPAASFADRAGGLYVTAPDSMSYTTAMLTISQSIFAEHCILRYVSPDPCPWWKSHNVQINLNYKTSQLSNTYPFTLTGTRVDKTPPTFKIDSSKSNVRYITAYDPFPCESGMYTLLQDSTHLSLVNFRRVTLPVVTSDSAWDSLVVIDTMASADAWYIAKDSAGNIQKFNIHYDPPADVLPPVFGAAVWAGSGVNTMDVTEQRPWDRKLETVTLAPGAVNLVLDSVHFYTKQYARAYLRILDMKDSAGGCLIAVDSFNNTSTGCFTYAGAGKDILAPLFAQDPIAIPRGTMTGIVTEKRAGDQGIKTVKLTALLNSNSPQVTATAPDQFNVKSLIGDTLYSARTLVEAWDSAGNHLTDTMRYDPLADSYLPKLTHTPNGPKNFDFTATEVNPWDRGIKSLQFLPTSTNATATAPVFIDRWHAGLSATVTDPTQNATMIVSALDSVGHLVYDTAKFIVNAPPQALNPFGDSTLDFGSLVLLGSSTKSISFKNNNDSSVTLSLATINGDDSVFSLTSTNSITVAPHATTTIAFDFHPRWIGNWKAVLPLVHGTDKFGSVTLIGQSTALFSVAFDQVRVPHIGESGTLTMSLDAPVKPINLDNIQITVKYDPSFMTIGDPIGCTGSLDTGICLYNAAWTGGTEGNKIVTLTRKDDRLASSLSFDRSQIKIPFTTFVAPTDTTLVQATTGSGMLASMVTAVDGMITAGDTCGTAMMRSTMNGDLQVKIIGVHPNPASSTIDLHLQSATDDDATVRFVSMLGESARSIPLHLAAGEQHISLTDLPQQSGVYEMLISSGASVVRERVEILK